MKRKKRPTRKQKQESYKTIARWLEAKRKKAAKQLNEELNKEVLK